MVDATTNSLTTVHIINFLMWQREGQTTFDIKRAQLLDTLAGITGSLQDPEQPGDTVILGGETIMFQDVAGVSNRLLVSLLEYTQQGKLAIGPWYTYLDGLLADGEAFVRSLLLGYADSETYDLNLSTIAIMPDDYQGSHQLPQILAQFGINTVFVRTTQPSLPLPFKWQSPGGQHVLVIPHHLTDNLQASIKQQRKFQPDGPFLWAQSVELDNPVPKQDTTSDLSLEPTTLADFVNAVRERLPDEYRPLLSDVLYLQSINNRSGRYSARISMKQEIALLQATLVHYAETLLALALTFGEVSNAHIQMSLLDLSWRTLLQNMAPNPFAGAVSDETILEMNVRNRRVADNSQRIIEKALDGLAGKRYQTGDLVNDETYITVWNPHGHSVTQIVELKLDLPKDLHPNVLLSHDGEEQAFTWDAKQSIIDFRATIPPVGYSVYTLKISKQKTADYNQNRTIAGRSIGTASGESLGFTGSRLDWTFADGTISDLIVYYDGGDAGDIWQYQEPHPDVMMKGSLVDVVQVESTPTYERLIFRHRMRIAPKLKNGEERVRGLRVLDINTTATYHNGLPGVQFKTIFTNTAEDHRLRVHLRTGLNVDQLYIKSPYGLNPHPLSTDEATGDLPVQSTLVLGDKTRAMAIFTRGLYGIEPIHEDGQVTLAITLLRATGMLDKSQGISAQSAQMPDDFVAEFMVLPLPSPPDLADIMRTSMTYQAPLQAMQYTNKPDGSNHSYLQIDSKHIVMTALKPPQNHEKGLVIRLHNTSSSEDTVAVKTAQEPKKATQISLGEKSQHDLEISDNQVTLTLAGYEIASIYLQF